MSSRRETSAPPTIPGHTYVRLLGMGGFADVFLYEQQMPRRAVAVKVLLASHLGDEVRARFRVEADLMARLSHHPSIVTVHHADVASDGRPYLVMEHCSRPSLGERFRTERMPVAEVLRIGVRLASAVESAHRAGVLHRDIKPANVLVTDFGWPALTDFGIAATTSWSTGSAVGMSIPWAPPELLAEQPHGDERSDVYSLAATVYSLLARRSPFEVPGGANNAADLISRIERTPLAPTGRGDVPDSLQAVLERAMDKDPARRHPSALAFARALQQVEAELLLPLTALDLPGEVGGDLPDEQTRPVPDGEAGQATRLRPVRSISATASPGPGSPVTPDAAVGAPGPRREDGSASEPTDPADVPEEWRRAALAVLGPDGDGAAPPRRSTARAVTGVLAGVVVVGAVVAAAVLASEGPVPPTTAQESTAPVAPAPALPRVRAVPAPTDVQGVPGADGTVVFTWVNPEPEDGDAYRWTLLATSGGAAPAPSQAVSEPTVTVVREDPAAPLCVEVSIVREDGRMSSRPATGCVAG